MEKSSPSELKPWQEIAILALTNNFKITLKTSLNSEGKITQNITEIDLIKGVKNQLSADNLDSDNQTLINFHRQELARINDTWQKNRETIAKAIKILKGEKVELLKSPSSSILSTKDKWSETKNNSITELNNEEIEPSQIEISELENDDLFSEDLFSDESEIIDQNEESENWLDQENKATNDDELDEKEEIIYTAEDVEFEQDEIDEEDIFSIQDEDIVATGDEATEEDWDNLMEDEEETPDIENSATELAGEWQGWLEEDENDGEDAEYKPDGDIDWNEEEWQNQG
ncbi:MAG: hypothetical protein IGQ45_14825 [Cyanobacterium sp. T60_A2020_053]|nr:hypothetical protein [Cyanobacterium sp. T60_A2020_053]